MPTWLWIVTGLGGLLAFILGLSRPVPRTIRITTKGGKIVSQIQMGAPPLALKLQVTGTKGEPLPLPPNPAPSWGTTDPTIATVSSPAADGSVQVNAVGVGSCNVTATDAIGAGGAVLTAAPYPITVTDVPTAIAIVPA